MDAVDYLRSGTTVLTPTLTGLTAAPLRASRTGATGAGALTLRLTVPAAPRFGLMLTPSPPL